MTTPITETKRALNLVHKRTLVRLCDAGESGIHPEALRRLVNAGKIVRVSRGVYSLPNRDQSQHIDLAHAATRIRHGVICLLSALQYHDIGTQLPHEVWMMIDRRAHHPRVDHPPMRFVLGSGRALTAGVSRVEIDGHQVRMTNIAKTVVDCFRFRRHVGLDVALEALREVLRKRKCTPAELSRLSVACRVGALMRPYLEALA